MEVFHTLGPTGQKNGLRAIGATGRNPLPGRIYFWSRYCSPRDHDTYIRHKKQPQIHVLLFFWSTATTRTVIPGKNPTSSIIARPAHAGRIPPPMLRTATTECPKTCRNTTPAVNHPGVDQKARSQNAFFRQDPELYAVRRRQMHENAPQHLAITRRSHLPAWGGTAAPEPSPTRKTQLQPHRRNRHFMAKQPTLHQTTVVPSYLSIRPAYRLTVAG